MLKLTTTALLKASTVVVVVIIVVDAIKANNRTVANVAITNDR